MRTVLITGANRGLGLEFARQYCATGWTVIATARDIAQADTLRATGAEVLALDVSDPASIDALGFALRGRSVDLLINNAGLMGDSAGTALSADPKAWHDIFAVNTLGPALVTRALLPSLALSSNPVGLTLGSQAGMLSRITSPARAAYCATKAAAHAVTISLGKELAEQGVLYFALRPGWVRTDMTDGTGNFDPPETVTLLRETIARALPEWAGLFIDRTGRIYPYTGDFQD